MAVLKKGARITGPDRTKLAAELKKAYDKGKSIRELADTHGRSYGFVHRVLSDSPLRTELVAAGHRRLEHFSLANSRRRLLDALQPFVAGAGVASG